MAAKKNGRDRGSQPAKPSRRITEKVESVVAADRGMTIREEFIKAAMQGFIACYGRKASSAEVSRFAAEYADATIAEMDKGPQP